MNVDKAPINYNNEEAHAWAAGYEAAIEHFERIIEESRAFYADHGRGVAGQAEIVVLLDETLAAIRQEGDDA